PCAWQRSPFSPGFPPSCAASRQANRTKGVRVPPPHEYRHGPTAERARDPLPHRAIAARADQHHPLHTRLVVMAKTPPGGSSARPQPHATNVTSATVVLAQDPLRGSMRCDSEGIGGFRCPSCSCCPRSDAPDRAVLPSFARLAAC